MNNARCVLLLCLGLCLSTLAEAQTIEELFVTTDMDINWKLDGQPMDPLKSGDHKVVPVSLGEHLIQAATTDGVATMRTRINTTIPPKFDADFGQGKFWVCIQLQSQHDRQQKMQDPETAGQPAKTDATPPAAAL